MSPDTEQHWQPSLLSESREEWWADPEGILLIIDVALRASHPLLHRQSLQISPVHTQLNSYILSRAQ